MSTRVDVPGEGPITHAAFNVWRIREDFPILRQKAYGKPLVYLDNAATSQKPQMMLDALVRFYTTQNANVHRGVHLLSERSTEEYEAARGTVQAFLGAARPGEIVFTRGTTESINLVAQAYGRANVGAGDEILITGLEHHSNIVPWQMLAEEKRAVLRVAPIDDRGEVILDGRACIERPGHGQSRAANDRDGAPARGRGPHRRGAGRAAREGRCPGARLRFLRLLRPQGLRTDRHRNPLRKGGSARIHAAVARRRGHDSHRHFCEDDV
jgi:hypothetical protein